MSSVVHQGSHLSHKKCTFLYYFYCTCNQDKLTISRIHQLPGPKTQTGQVFNVMHIRSCALTLQQKPRYLQGHAYSCPHQGLQFGASFFQGMVGQTGVHSCIQKKLSPHLLYDPWGRNLPIAGSSHWVCSILKNLKKKNRWYKGKLLCIEITQKPNKVYQ